MSVNMPKSWERALKWFSGRDHADRFGFGNGDPSLSTVTKLCDAGLVERIGCEPGTFGLTRFAITPAGRAALDQGVGEP